mgnify:CR=1 FL=1
MWYSVEKGVLGVDAIAGKQVINFYFSMDSL